MNKREATALVNLIRYIKREWKRQSEILQANRKLEWSRLGGAEQAWHDALEAVVHFYGLDIKVDETIGNFNNWWDIPKGEKKCRNINIITHWQTLTNSRPRLYAQRTLSKNMTRLSSH